MSRKSFYKGCFLFVLFSLLNTEFSRSQYPVDRPQPAHDAGVARSRWVAPPTAPQAYSDDTRVSELERDPTNVRIFFDNDFRTLFFAGGVQRDFSYTFRALHAVGGFNAEIRCSLSRCPVEPSGEVDCLRPHSGLRGTVVSAFELFSSSNFDLATQENPFTCSGCRDTFGFNIHPNPHALTRFSCRLSNLGSHLLTLGMIRGAFDWHLHFYRHH